MTPFGLIVLNVTSFKSQSPFGSVTLIEIVKSVESIKGLITLSGRLVPVITGGKFSVLITLMPEVTRLLNRPELFSATYSTL